MQICQIHLCGLVVATTCYLQNISRISITISPPTLMFSSSRSLVIQRFAEDLTIDPILLQVVTLELKTSHKSARTSKWIWTNPEFEDKNCFAYAFMSHVVDPSIIVEAIEGLNNT